MLTYALVEVSSYYNTYRISIYDFSKSFDLAVNLPSKRKCVYSFFPFANKQLIKVIDLGIRLKAAVKIHLSQTQGSRYKCLNKLT